MSDAHDVARLQLKEVEREIRNDRKFTLEEAIARLAGPGMLKGESPVGRLQQAEFEIESWLRNHLNEAGGALGVVINRRVKGSELLLNNFEQPLVVLAACCQKLLASEYLLMDLVRDADLEWGRMMCERPFLERAGAPSHPDDPYTIDSVRRSLSEVFEQLAASKAIELSESQDDAKV